MKGRQKIILDGEAVNEAIQEYLAKRMRETVVVKGIKGEPAVSDGPLSPNDDTYRTKLTVTFTAEPVAISAEKTGAEVK